MQSTSLKLRVHRISVISAIRHVFEALVYLLPFVPVAYLYYFQRTDLLNESHMFHMGAIMVATLEGVGISYVCWRSYMQTGEQFVKRLTLGFVGFTVVYSMHGIFTPVATDHMALFLLYGPFSRLFMAACLLYALIERQGVADPELQRRNNIVWWWWCLRLLLINAAIGILATGPYADEPWMRRAPELTSLILYGIALVRICTGRMRSPLVHNLAVSLVWFAASSLSFMLAAPWNHQWWLAHGLSAVGFSVLGYGILKAFQSTYALEKIFTTTELYEDLATTNDRLTEALNRQQSTNSELRQQMHKLEEAQQQFADLMRLAPDGVLVVSPEGLILVANLKAEAIFGYPAGGMRGLPVEELVNPEARTFHRKQRELFLFNPRMRDMGSEHVALKGMRKDGSPVLTHIRLGGLMFDGMKCGVAFVRESDDVVMRYMQLRLKDLAAIERGQLLASVLACVPQILFELRRSGGGTIECDFLSSAAEAALQLVPVDAPDHRAQALLNRVYPADLPGLFAAIETASVKQTDWSVQWRLHVPGQVMTRMHTQATIQSGQTDGRQGWLCITTPEPVPPNLRTTP